MQVYQLFFRTKVNFETSGCRSGKIQHFVREFGEIAMEGDQDIEKYWNPYKGESVRMIFGNFEMDLLSFYKHTK